MPTLDTPPSIAAMLRHLALLLWLATAADSAPAQRATIDRENRSVTPDMQALPLHIGGRVEARGQEYRHQWPGVYFEGAFRGDKVVLRFDDARNEYRLRIDDLPAMAIARPGKSEVTVTTLSAGAHRIRLDKVTEGGGIASFGGFHVPAGKALPAPPPRGRQIEFIGDSSMTGYGARSRKRECTGEEARLLSDTPDAFAALAARHYDADYQVNAISGRGLIRNYGGSAPEAAMIRVYPRLFPDSPAPPYRNPGWRPQIVVIKLQADLLGFRPDARWKDFDALIADYVESFGRFVTDLHRRAPEASILVWWFDSVGAASAESRIAAAARKAGVPDIAFLPFSGAGYRNAGCHAHFDLEEQRRVADWLILQIDAHPEYWRGR